MRLLVHHVADLHAIFNSNSMAFSLSFLCSPPDGCKDLYLACPVIFLLYSNKFAPKRLFDSIFKFLKDLELQEGTLISPVSSFVLQYHHLSPAFAN